MGDKKLVLIWSLQTIEKEKKMATNYVVKGKGFNKNGEFIPMSFTTNKPMKLINKLAIEKVTHSDTGETLYQREVDKLPFGNWWDEKSQSHFN